MDPTELLPRHREPSQGNKDNLELIRMAAIELLKAIRDCTPSGADQIEAIKSVRLAVHWANAAIAVQAAL